MKWYFRAVLLFFTPIVSAYITYLASKLFGYDNGMEWWDIVEIMHINELTISLFFISFAEPYAVLYEEALNYKVDYAQGSEYIATPSYVLLTYLYFEDGNGWFLLPFIIIVIIMYINSFIYREHKEEIAYKRELDD